MRHIDFSPLYRSSVGFERMLDMLDSVSGYDGSSYPPYNIERLGDNTYRITMAVAGFGEGELKVEVKGAELKDGLLHVELVRNVPEKLKARTIAISDASGARLPAA